MHRHHYYYVWTGTGDPPSVEEIAKEFSDHLHSEFHPGPDGGWNGARIGEVTIHAARPEELDEYELKSVRSSWGKEPFTLFFHLDGESDAEMWGLACSAIEFLIDEVGGGDDVLADKGPAYAWLRWTRPARSLAPSSSRPISIPFVPISQRPSRTATTRA